MTMQSTSREVSMEIPVQVRPAKTPMDRWSFIAAVLLAAFYLATSIYIASQSRFWYDEVTAVLIARLSHWTTIWQVVAREATDTMPPVYHMMVGIFIKLFGHPETAARLPSALAFTAGLLLIFDCTRRLTDGLHGLVALSLLTCSLLPHYGHQARAYSIYFMLAALSLWVWIHTSNERRSAAIAFGAVFFLGVTFHYYFILCLVPYAAWEALNWKPWRLPSQKMIAALLGVGWAFAVWWIPINAARRFFPSDVKSFLSIYNLPGIFSQFFPDGVFLLALVMIWIASVRTGDSVIALQPMRPSERVGWLFLLIPLAAFVMAELKTNVIVVRYVIATLPGPVVACSTCLWRHFRGRRLVSLGVFLLLAAFGLARQVAQTRDPERFSEVRPETRKVLSLEDALRNDGKQFIVVCDHGLQMEARIYSKHPERYAVLVLPDTDIASRIRPEVVLSRYYPMAFWSMEDLRKHARETALIAPGKSDYTRPAFLRALDTLKQDGFQIRTRFTQPLEVVYFE